MSKRVTPTQAMAALDELSKLNYEGSRQWIDVLEGYVYCGVDTSRAMAKSELRAIEAEYALMSLRMDKNE